MIAKNNFRFLLLFLTLMLSQASVAWGPFYLGINGGYGSTTWGNLVPNDLTETLSTSLPVRVSEGGIVWGFFAGYEIIPSFAFEAEYMQYPKAKIYLDPLNNEFSYSHGSISKLVTRTSSVSLVAKIMMMIPNTKIRAFSSFGAAEIHRNDSTVNRWRLSPTFNAGLDYEVTNHVMTELVTEYTAGYGQSEFSPINHYIPFLYSIFLRLGYRF